MLTIMSKTRPNRKAVETLKIKMSSKKLNKSNLVVIILAMIQILNSNLEVHVKYATSQTNNQPESSAKFVANAPPVYKKH